MIPQHVAVTLIAVYVVPVTPAALGPKLSALSLPRRTDGPRCCEAAFAWRAPARLPRCLQPLPAPGMEEEERMHQDRDLNYGLPILPRRKQHSTYGLG